MSPRNFLTTLFEKAVAAADPMRVVPPRLPDPPKGRTVVIAAGKGAAAMARAVEEHWDGPISGIAVTRYGHGAPCDRIEVVEAGHPMPDAAGQNASLRACELMTGLTEDDLALFLISGGGSALLNVPAAGITLADKQAVTGALLKGGAAISDINCVRKHLSAVKGGRLAALAAPARVVTLIISDVPGDDPATVASGPSIADPTTLEDARAVLAKYRITPPDTVAALLGRPESETPKSVPRADTRIIATARDALDAAAAFARDTGVEAIILGDDLEGEARDVARQHGQLVLGHAPGLIISGGEVTVTLGDAGGKGGPNAEYALALAIALKGHENIHAIACDTDGIDGDGDAAGAIISPDTLSRATAAGMDAGALLDAHDSYGFFNKLGDHVITGPTLTNVNDFRAILIGVSG
jgi:glycerate 2-kinase